MAEEERFDDGSGLLPMLFHTSDAVLKTVVHFWLISLVRKIGLLRLGWGEFVPVVAHISGCEEVADAPDSNEIRLRRVLEPWHHDSLLPEGLPVFAGAILLALKPFPRRLGPQSLESLH